MVANQNNVIVKQENVQTAKTMLQEIFVQNVKKVTTNFLTASVSTFQIQEILSKNEKKLSYNSWDLYHNYQPVNVMLMDLLIILVIQMENVLANLQQSLESNAINVLKVSQDFLNVINVLMDILVINVKVHFPSIRNFSFSIPFRYQLLP